MATQKTERRAILDWLMAEITVEKNVARKTKAERLAVERASWRPDEIVEILKAVRAKNPVADNGKNRINWFRIIDDIERVGFSDTNIAKYLGLDKSQVCRYKGGAEPSHSHGERLLRMHMVYVLSVTSGRAG